MGDEAAERKEKKSWRLRKRQARGLGRMSIERKAKAGQCSSVDVNTFLIEEENV